MDFWNWLWIIAFFVMMFGGWKLFTDMGRRALSRHLSEQTPAVDPWADFKRLAAETRKRKKAERDDWSKQFQTLLRATCTHEYDDQEYKEGWWRCVLCGYQKPWVWEEGCSCNFRMVMGNREVYHRSGNCCLHGMPRLIAYNKRAQ